MIFHKKSPKITHPNKKISFQTCESFLVLLHHAVDHHREDLAVDGQGRRRVGKPGRRRRSRQEVPQESPWERRGGAGGRPQEEGATKLPLRDSLSLKINWLLPFSEQSKDRLRRVLPGDERTSPVSAIWRSIQEEEGGGGGGVQATTPASLQEILQRRWPERQREKEGSFFQWRRPSLQTELVGHDAWTGGGDGD